MLTVEFMTLVDGFLPSFTMRHKCPYGTDSEELIIESKNSSSENGNFASDS